MSQRLLLLTVFSVFAVAGPAFGQEVDFERDVLPILQERCYECHGEERQRGDLRLDSMQAALRGGDQGIPALTPGEPEESNLLTRITLPPDDIDIMPPKGDVLTDEQVEIIRRWIEQGGTYGEGGPIVVPEADPEALSELHQLGALAMPLARDTNLINVDFRAEAENIGDSQLELLNPVAEQLAWLNLSGTRITDEGLRGFEKFENLSRLHLDQTAVSDAGLAHLTDLGRLEYLNLYANENITDAGIEHLKQMESLRRLYLWQTKVTDEGATELQEALPELQIDRGWENRPPVEVQEIAGPGEPVNATCPVSGEDVNAEFTVTLANDQVVGFCCGDCRGKFIENPVAFADKVEVADGALGAVNDRCLLSGEEINPELAVFVEERGEVLGFCCSICRERFLESPDAVLEQLRAGDETAAAGPVNDTCPVSGEPVDAAQVVEVDGKKLGFCCGNCKAKYEENPEQFADKVAELLK